MGKILGKSIADKALLREASSARRHSYSPYSRFAVGAALLGRSGKVHLGSNVENGSYGLAMCAERIAIFKAISEGERSFSKIAVAGPGRKPCMPCGACRQVLWEFAPGLQIVVAGPRGGSRSFALRKLLPLAFDKND